MAWFTIAIATDPATEILPPPAPAIDCAPYVEVASAPSVVTVAATVRSWAWIVTPAGTCARFVTFARVSATAAPIVAVAPCDAEPFALDDASVFADVFSATAVPAVTVIAGPRIVSARTVDSVIATAAATLTLPCEVEALGVDAEPVPDPPLAVDESSAKSRWSATC